MAETAVWSMSRRLSSVIIGLIILAADSHTARSSLLQPEQSSQERVYGQLSTRIIVFLTKLSAVINIFPRVVIDYLLFFQKNYRYFIVFVFYLDTTKCQKFLRFTAMSPNCQNIWHDSRSGSDPGLDPSRCLPVGGKPTDTPAPKGLRGLRYPAAYTPVADHMAQLNFHCQRAQ